MPNTLAHAGAQGLATRTALPDVDLRWVYLGCVIPDVPWILQRAAHVMIPGVDPYLLRSYVIIQASLLGCVVLSAAAALLAQTFWRTWVILAGNAVLHLGIDAMQTKWGNGVHFCAPFSWDLTNWGLFWPESAVTYGLTVFGLGYILWHWQSSLRGTLNLVWARPARCMGMGSVLVGYFALPLLLLQAPIEANTHSLRTLQKSEDRVGHTVAFDRQQYLETQNGAVIEYFGGRVSVEPLKVEAPATVSLRGTFVEENKIQATAHHVHAGGLRNYASYLGLSLIAFIWIVALWKGGGEDR
jgi:hypothetical protein